MRLTYARLRQMHFRKSMADRFRGMGKTALIAVACIGGAGLVPIIWMMHSLVDGLMALSSPDTAAIERAGVLLGWQLLSLGLLWSLRRSIFMQEAESFFATLPISSRAVWRADVLIALQCLSILLVPLAWLFYMLWNHLQPMQASVAHGSYLLMTSVGLMVNLLLLRGMCRHAVVMALPMLGLLVMTPQSTLGFIVLAATATLAATIVVRMKLPQAATQSGGRVRAGYERLALVTALVLPVSIHELRERLLIHAACLLGAGTFALTLLAGQEPDVGLANGLLIGLMAVASVTLYRLPMMIRSTVLSRFDFLAGHRHFRRRVMAFAVASPVVLFLACLGASWAIARHALPAGSTDGALPSYPLYFYACLFGVGALVTIWSRTLARWVIPTAHFALTMILLMVALT